MSTNHTPEPWTYIVHNDALTQGLRVRIEIINGDGNVVSVSDETARYGVFSGKWHQKIADMESECSRIVACVNALAGLNPEAVQDVVAALRGILREIEYCVDDGSFERAIVDANVGIIAARAALAKLEGKG